MRRALPGLIMIVAAAACGDSSGPAAGFECLGAPLPTTAPASVIVSGQVLQNAFSPTALGGATVEAFRTGIATALATTTSNTPGFYTLSITTGGTPVDGYLHVTHSGHVDTYAYPSRPIFADLATNVLMATSTELTLLRTAVGVPAQAGTGLIGVIVKDCDGNELAGATVTTNPAGTVRYNAGTAPSPTATSTSTDGLAYVLNVPAGNVTVMATASGGQTLRQHIVNARADVVTLTEIQP